MITNQKPRRIRILGFHKDDACYGDREKYISKTGMFTPATVQHHPGYFAGYMKYDPECLKDGHLCDYFFAVRYKRI